MNVRKPYPIGDLNFIELTKKEEEIIKKQCDKSKSKECINCKIKGYDRLPYCSGLK